MPLSCRREGSGQGCIWVSWDELGQQQQDDYQWNWGGVCCVAGVLLGPSVCGAVPVRYCMATEVMLGATVGGEMCETAESFATQVLRVSEGRV